MKLTTASWIACCLAAAGCSVLAGRYGPVDSRNDRPPPVIFDPAKQSLPGSTIADAAAIEGIFSFFRTEPQAELDGGHVVPFFYYALHLKLEPDGRYELVYQAYTHARALDDPRLHALDVRETGRFSLAGNSIRLEPDGTTLTEKKAGRLATQAIPDENRAYLAALDGAYLNLAGPCARYQVEPICRQRRDVWYSLRLGEMDWPIPPLR